MKLLVVSKIDAAALGRLCDEHEVIVALNPPREELRRLLADCDVLIFRSGVEITPDLLEAASRLRLLLRAGSGFDNVDLGDLARRGIAFERIPGPGARAVAELTFGLLLALSRRLLPADASMRAGRWLKAELEGCLLAGKTLGIVGLGSIGTQVARMGAAWDLAPIGCVEHPSPARAERYAAMGIRLTGFAEVLASADYVTVHVPLKDSTQRLIDAAALRRMKPTAFLINCSRGGVLDEPALEAALTAERIAGAALDVHAVEREGHTSPFAALPNVVLTPHIGASTADSQRAIGLEILRIVGVLAAQPNGRRRRLHVPAKV